MKIRLNPKWEKAHFAYKFVKEDGTFLYNECEWRWETKEDADYDWKLIQAGKFRERNIPMYETIP